jgi:hypothetical protein
MILVRASLILVVPRSIDKIPITVLSFFDQRLECCITDSRLINVGSRK